MSPTRDQIQPGDEVYSSDGDLVGTVAEIQATHLVMESTFFPTDYAVPVTAITQAGNGEVMLNVAKGAIQQSGWDTVPRRALGGLQATAALSMDAIETMDGLGTADVMSAPAARVQGQSQVAGYEAIHQGEIVIPLHEEELFATVRAAPAFVSRVQQRVVTEERVLEAPVTEPQIRVERRIVDRAASENDAGAFEEIVITIPLTAEEVELRKQAQVTEELIVTREVVHRTRQVRGTVRREAVEVIDEGVTTNTHRERGRQA